MHLKLPPLAIPDDAPFQNDSLKRSESAELLTQFISTIEQPFVLAVDAAFGMGKTTFLDMWRKHLRQKGFPVLLFNAWETDFTGDPLVSFIGEMASQMEPIGGPTTEAKEYLSKAKELAGALAKKSLPAAVKIATAGILDLDKLTEDTLGNLAAKLAQERIDSYEADKKTITGFKDRLERFIKEIPRDGKANNLIVLVDELDRCRPSYALELLERIKHFFNVNGLLFVLAVDRAHLAHSIRSIYGSGIDADGYLRRFIDLEYRLPRPSGDDFCKSLYQRFRFKAFFESRKGEHQHDAPHFMEHFSKLAGVFGLSLRTQEQMFSQLSVVLRTVKPNYFIYPPLLVTLLVLKASAPDLYRKFVEKHADAQNVLEFIRAQPGGHDFLVTDRAGRMIEAFLLAATRSQDDVMQLVTQLTEQASNQAEGSPERDRNEDLVRVLSYLLRKDLHGSVPYLVKKIEIAERFVEPTAEGKE